MFQSTEDFNIDEDFLNDAFGSKNNEQTKRNTETFIFQPIKKFCPQNENVSVKFVPSTSKFNENTINKPPSAQLLGNWLASDHNLRPSSQSEQFSFQKSSFLNSITSKTKGNFLNPIPKIQPNKSLIPFEPNLRPFNLSEEFCMQNSDFVIPSTTNLDEKAVIITTNKQDGQMLKVFNRKSPLKNRKVIQRKFPGPAGLLPENKVNININTLEDCDTTINNKIIEPDEIICSQLSDNCFKEGLWVIMCKEYYIDNVKLYLPEKYSISWVKMKSLSKQLLGQKTPFLAALIKSIDSTVKDPMVVLKDPTGEMSGTLHHEVWDEFSEKLHVGAVLVLRQVGVLTTVKKRYLNITPNNVITIYSYKDFNATGTGGNSQCSQKCQKVLTTRVQSFTSIDFMGAIEDNKKEYREKQINKTIDTNNPFFKNNISISNSFIKGNSFNFGADRSINKENITKRPLQMKKDNLKTTEKSFRAPIEKQINTNLNVISDKKSVLLNKVRSTSNEIQNINLSIAKSNQNDNSKIMNINIVSESKNQGNQLLNKQNELQNMNLSNTMSNNDNLRSKNFTCDQTFNKNPQLRDLIDSTGTMSNKNKDFYVYNKLFNKNPVIKNVNPSSTISKNNELSQISNITESGGDNYNSNLDFKKISPSITKTGDAIIKTPVYNIISPSVNENLAYNKIFNRSENPYNRIFHHQNLLSSENQIPSSKKNNLSLGAEQSSSQTVDIAENNSPNVISASCSENIMSKIFANKRKSEFKFESNCKPKGPSMFKDTMLFRRENKQENDFLTSTQKENNSGDSNNFFESDNLLDGLENSFLEDF